MFDPTAERPQADLMRWFLIATSLLIGGILSVLCTADMYAVYARGWEGTVFGHGPVIFCWATIMAIAALLIADALYLLLARSDRDSGQGKM
jgi:hypothetical protein